MAEVLEQGEGFFCPICKQDLHTFTQLDVHFREEHDETKGNKIKLNIRSIFDKAKNLSKPKNRIVEDGASAVAGSHNEPEDNLELEGPVTNVSGIASYWPPQEFGAETDYTGMYKRMRDERLSGIGVETNRLVIRLEKLFRNLKENSPKTTRQMKTVEKGVVPWKKDKEEKHCMGCGRRFGPQRRKHHCRLCGGIMCKQCSEFMTHTELYPLICECPDYGELAPKTTVRIRKLAMKSQRLGSKRDDDDEAAIDELRICSSCIKLIQRRLDQIAALETPMITALYENMQLTMTEADRVKPSFVEIAESLLSGAQTFSLTQASRKRQELVRLYESIDSISKQIFSMGGSETDTRIHKLCRSVRVYASGYLQDNLITLPTLPNEAKLREIRDRVEKEAQERLKEYEKARELKLKQQKEQEELAAKASEEKKGIDVRFKEIAAKAREETKGFDVKFKNFSKELSTKVAETFKKDSEAPNTVTFKKESEAMSIQGSTSETSSGWMCSAAAKSVDSGADPFDLQKQQLLSYIRQAREANRMDEVYALEDSLREIEATIIKQKYGLTSDS